MTQNGNVVRVKVWGPLACFTRPEMKVERVSYPIMTPSAARGVLEAILCHPVMKQDKGKRQDRSGFYWTVKAIHILQRGGCMSIRRNEVQSKISKTRPTPIDILEDRTQRHTLALRNVSYIIEARIEVPFPSSDNNIEKFTRMFHRRVEKGQCYHRPALGCREFAADFSLPVPDDWPDETYTEELGMMLHDWDYRPAWREKAKALEPVFFDARVERGVLAVPPWSRPFLPDVMLL